eukprot:325166-Chlamydomonas_euryale.AAC.3
MTGTGVGWKVVGTGARVGWGVDAGGWQVWGGRCWVWGAWQRGRGGGGGEGSATRDVLKARALHREVWMFPTDCSSPTERSNHWRRSDGRAPGWRHSRAGWQHLRARWRHLRAGWRHLRARWRHLRARWRHLRARWRHLRAGWRHSRAGQPRTENHGWLRTAFNPYTHTHTPHIRPSIHPPGSAQTKHPHTDAHDQCRVRSSLHFTSLTEETLLHTSLQSLQRASLTRPRNDSTASRSAINRILQRGAQHQPLPPRPALSIAFCKGVHNTSRSRHGQR